MNTESRIKSETILVTGATGTLGREVVTTLLRRGYNVRGLSSKIKIQSRDHSHLIFGDLSTGNGLQKAVQDCHVIIHCASDPGNPDSVDINGTRNLLDNARKAGVKHFVFISIVGADKSDFPYYSAKVETENLIMNSGIPYSILRTTQFHNFILFYFIKNFRKEKNEIYVPEGLRFQSIDVAEVALKLVNIAEQDPIGMLPDFGGPEILSLDEMCREYIGNLNENMKIKMFDANEGLYQVFKTGNNLCHDHKEGKITWNEFLIKNKK